jgi:hypothetical protein
MSSRLTVVIVVAMTQVHATVGHIGVPVPTVVRISTGLASNRPVWDPFILAMAAIVRSLDLRVWRADS